MNTYVKLCATDREAEKPKMRYLKRDDDEYPQILNRYERMPEGLYVIGDMPDPGRKSVAIVGSRSCSEYGRKIAGDFARVLAGCGVQIISGMALGIDSAAHEGALKGKGRTFAVLGCGADVCYPSSKERLYRQIIENGGIISEYEPGAEALAWHFPVRNRIISGMCDAVIVVEARIKSGSLITANYAIEQNKVIYAVPGRIEDALSSGTNDLISQGAIPALTPDRILNDLGLGNAKQDYAGVELTGLEASVYSHITSDPRNIDMLCLESGMELPKLAQVLTRLLVKGMVREAGPALYVRT